MLDYLSEENLMRISVSSSTVSSGDGSVSPRGLRRLLAGRPVELSGGGSYGSGVHDLFLQF